MFISMQLSPSHPKIHAFCGPKPTSKAPSSSGPQTAQKSDKSEQLSLSYCFETKIAFCPVAPPRFVFWPGFQMETSSCGSTTTTREKNQNNHISCYRVIFRKWKSHFALGVIGSRWILRAAWCHPKPACRKEQSLTLVQRRDILTEIFFL